MRSGGVDMDLEWWTGGVGLGWWSQIDTDEEWLGWIDMDKEWIRSGLIWFRSDWFGW